MPITRIQFCGSVPLDKNYHNTLYFGSGSDQRAYFTAKALYTVTRQTYLREAGVLQVGISKDQLDRCNYMCYLNRDKWYYAFLDSVDYINEEVSIVRFTIDPLQTYLFDVKIGQTLVEREHSDGDVAGYYIMEEGFPVGNYEFANEKTSGLFDDWLVVVAVPYSMAEIKDTAESVLAVLSPSAAQYNGLISGNHLYGFDSATELDKFVATLGAIDAYDSVSSMFFFPKSFTSAHTISITIPVTRYPLAVTITYYEAPSGNAEHIIVAPGRPTTNGNYPPKNQKLLTWPYLGLCLYSDTGKAAAFSYEDFADPSRPSFSVQYDVTTGGFRAVPMHYKGLTRNYAEAVRLADMPMCTYNADTFRAWFAQTRNNFVSTLAVAGIGAGIVAMSGGLAAPVVAGAAVGAGAKLLECAVNTVGGGLSAALSNEPEKLGNGSVGSALGVAYGTLDFRFYVAHMKLEYAESVDDYFTRFGYASKTVKYPNTHVRARYTYVKTIGCIAVGEAPSEAIDKIQQIYDNGILWWRDHSSVGYYGGDNSPI